MDLNIFNQGIRRVPSRLNGITRILHYAHLFLGVGRRSFNSFLPFQGLRQFQSTVLSIFYGIRRTSCLAHLNNQIFYFPTQKSFFSVKMEIMCFIFCFIISLIITKFDKTSNQTNIKVYVVLVRFSTFVYSRHCYICNNTMIVN